MKLFGYRLIVQKEKDLLNNRPNAKNYEVWSRKGSCPGCFVKTGSKHSAFCIWRKMILEGKEYNG